MRGQIAAHSRRLTVTGGGLARSASRVVDVRRERLTSRSRQLTTLPLRRLEGEDFRVVQWQRLLGAYDYQRQLERGYSVTRDGAGGVVRSVSSLAEGSVLLTELSDGHVASAVTAAPVPTDHGHSHAPHEAGQHDEGTQ